jgi:dihydropyrimidinase
MLDLVVRGGLVVTPSRVDRLDVGVAGGVIAALARPGELAAAREVDATGKVVLPGAVDPHVHLATGIGDAMTLDDFASGTVPAAFGGTTSIVEFAIPREGETAAAAVARRHREAGGKSFVDYAFHAVITEERFERSIAELEQLRKDGIGTVKVFSAYLDTIGLSVGRIHTVLRHCAHHNLMTLVHCETESLIREGVEATVAAGDLGPAGHARSRSALAEADAIRTVCDLAADVGAAVYIVHISTEEGAAVVAERRAAGQAVYGETCPQYLFLDDSVYARADAELWVCSPPIRPRSDVAALWREIERGSLQIVGSDHNCFDREQKEAGRHDFRSIPNGLPGIEFRLPLLVHAALTGRMDWQRLAILGAESPARATGLWPRKGAIMIGSDADFSLVDPEGSTDLGRGHMATDYSPFKGIVTRGSIEESWLRGMCLVQSGAFVGGAASGRYLRAERAEATGRHAPPQI